uniref:Uncharacterized protein n=1 Tax=Arundo donax TaxID=35708 RepID=A0A0A8Y2Y9_ARUDO
MLHACTVVLKCSNRGIAMN